MGKVGASQIGHPQFAEDIVQHAGGALDEVISDHRSRRLEAGKGEGFDEFLQRNAILQAHRYGDGEIVHQAAEGRAFLVHVDEYLPQPSILILAGMEIDLVPADNGLLGIALAAMGQALTLMAAHRLDDPLHDPLGDHRLLARRFRQDIVFLIVGKGEDLRRQRLRQFRAVAIQRICL